jgi:hypothetical protein
VLVAGAVVLAGAGVAVAILGKGSSPSHHATGSSATAPRTLPQGAPSLAGSRDCGGGLTAGPHTSCGFAENVREAFDQTGSGILTVASPATDQTYRMYCTSGSTHVCTGANHASVTFGDSGHYESQSCGAGLAVGPNTSCGFAKNVQRAYETSHAGVIRASSPTTASTYTMYCTDRSPHTCTGANNAAVYFP